MKHLKNVRKLSNIKNNPVLGLVIDYLIFECYGSEISFPFLKGRNHVLQKLSSGQLKGVEV